MTGLWMTIALLEADNVLGRVIYWNELYNRGITWQVWDSLLVANASKGDTGAVVAALDKMVSSYPHLLSSSARDSIVDKYHLPTQATPTQVKAYEFTKELYEQFKAMGGTDEDWMRATGLSLYPGKVPLGAKK